MRYQFRMQSGRQTPERVGSVQLNAKLPNQMPSTARTHDIDGDRFAMTARTGVWPGTMGERCDTRGLVSRTGTNPRLFGSTTVGGTSVMI